MVPRVLFLPGYACTSRIWQPVVDELGQQFEPVLVDWPTHQTPSFHALEDFAGWLAHKHPFGQYAAVVGHSMGGLVAIHRLAQHPVRGIRLILVESFLHPPGPFFRNLLLPGAEPRLIQQVTEMLGTQRAFYSPTLAHALREVDLPASQLPAGQDISAIYGDRGSGRPEQVIRELNWPGSLSERIPVSVVSLACHFPMLENPSETVSLLKSTLGL